MLARVRLTYFQRAAVMAALLVLGTAFTAHPTAAQSISQQEFSAFGSVPRTIRPQEPERIPYRRNGRRIDFFVDPGTLDEKLSDTLSRACQNRRFNQQKNRRLYVDVPMENGAVRRFGYADSRGLNLKDLDNRGSPNQVYLFDFEGTSECEVYAFTTVF